MIVKVRVLVPLTAMELGENDLVIEGGATTLVDALPVFPAPPFVEVTEPVTLFLAPAAEAVTVTLNVQVLAPAMVAPLNEITPVAAVVVSVPPHWAIEEVATVRPAGRASEKATPLSAVIGFGFVMVKLNVVVLPKIILAAPNALLMVGEATTATVSNPLLLASLISNTLPLRSTIAVFASVPGAVGVTAKVTLKEAPTGRVTAPPVAAQLKAVSVMEQLIVPAPVGAGTPGVTASAPWG